MADRNEIEIGLEFIAPEDPRWPQVERLRHDVLIAPFRPDGHADWNDHDPAASHLVAVEGDRVVGYARLIEEGDAARIRYVAVAADRQRTGLGTVLMAALVTEARNRGLRKVWLNARMKAIPFYERLGFRRVGDVFVTGHVNLEHVRMELEL